MTEVATYQAFAKSPPPDTQVQAVLKEKSALGFTVLVQGTELSGTIQMQDIGSDQDDRELRHKYTEPGETFRCFVKRVDASESKVLLTMIDPANDPWRRLPESLDVGSKVQAKVVGSSRNGYDLEIAKGVVGLLPISELAWDPKSAPGLKDDATVEVVIAEIARGDRRLVLSRRRLTRRPVRDFHSEDVEWERAVAAGATADEEARFRRRLWFDLLGAGVDASEPREPEGSDPRPQETLRISREGADGVVMEAEGAGQSVVLYRDGKVVGEAPFDRRFTAVTEVRRSTG